jgi:hypothetical protein
MNLSLLSILTKEKIKLEMCYSMLWLEGYSFCSFIKFTEIETRVLVQELQPRNQLKLVKIKNKLEGGSKIKEE